MSGSKKVLAERLHEGRVLSLVLNAPKGNVVDTPLLEALHAALEEHGSDPGLKLILFRGAGEHFSFGASVEEHAPGKVESFLPRFHSTFRKLADLCIPTAAVVRGQCLGGGMELASWCTWIFAHPGARFGQPEIRLGVFAPAASVFLPWRLGGGRAADLLVSGRILSADEALRIGLVQAVGEDPAALAEAWFKEQLAPLSASSLRYAERAARRGLLDALYRDLPELEKYYLRDLARTWDGSEGIASFLEKRRPDWKDH